MNWNEFSIWFDCLQINLTIPILIEATMLMMAWSFIWRVDDCLKSTSSNLIATFVFFPSLSLSLSLSLSHTHTLSLLLSSMCYPLYRWNVNGKREKNHLLLFNLLLLEIDAEPLSSIFHTHSPLFFFNELSSSLDCSLAHSHTQQTAEHAFASSGSVSRRYKKSFEGWSGINPMNWNLVFKRVE